MNDDPLTGLLTLFVANLNVVSLIRKLACTTNGRHYMLPHARHSWPTIDNVSSVIRFKNHGNIDFYTMAIRHALFITSDKSLKIGITAAVQAREKSRASLWRY